MIMLLYPVVRLCVQVTINMRLVKEGLGGGAILAASGASRWVLA